MGKRRILSRLDEYILPSDLPSSKETAQAQPSSPVNDSPHPTIKRPRPRPQQQQHLPSTPIQPPPLSQPSQPLPLTTAKSNGKEQQQHSFIDILQQLSNQQFTTLLINFNQRQNNNTNINNSKFKIPIFAHKELDLQKVWWYVWKQGGYQAVTNAKQWKEVCRHVVCLDDLKGQTSASYNMRQNYEKCLLEFEKYCYSGRFVVEYSERVSPSTELVELAAAAGGAVGNRGKHTAAGKAALQKRRMIKPRKLELASIQVDKEERVPDDVMIRDDDLNTVALPSVPVVPVERQGNKVNGRAIMHGLTVDVLHLQDLLHSYSKTSNQPISTLSAVAHKIIAYTILIHAIKSLSSLTQEMESAHPGGSTAATTAAASATDIPTIKLSSGVSYVVESESMQQGVPGDPAPLPPLTIRPPNLIEVPSPKTESWTDCIMHSNKCSNCSSSKVVVAVLPLKDENIMKRYLLSPIEREGMIKSNGGYFTTLKGVEEVVVDDNVLRDKTFLCFHYKLVKKGDGDDDYGGDIETQLIACCPPPATTTTNSKEEENCYYGDIVRESNVQVGIMVRKGVGGTCPLRAAAKGFQMNGLLAGLLDDFIVFVDEEEQMVVAEEKPCMDVVPTTAEENNGGQKVEAIMKVIDQVSNTNRDGNDDDDDGRLFTDLLLGPTGEEEQEDGERQKKKSSSDDEDEDDDEEGEVHDDEDDDDDDDKTGGSTESQQQQPKQRKNELVDEEGADALLEEMEQQQQQKQEEGGKETGVIAREPVENKSCSVDKAANELGMENGDVANNIDTNTATTNNNDQDLAPPTTTSQINEWQMPHHKLSLYTLSSRLELYCSEQLWSGLDRQTKCELHTVIRSVERQLLKTFTQSNHHRLLSRCIQLKEESIGADILSHPLSEAILLGRYDVPRYVGVTLNVLKKKMNEEEEEEKEEDYCEVIIQQAEEEGGEEGEEELGEKEGKEGEEGQVQKKKSESRALERYLLNQWTPSPTNTPISSTPVNNNVVMSFDQAMVALAACLVTIDHHPKSSATPWPFYLISTRDCFTYRLVPLETKIESNGRKYVKTEYFFPEGEHPLEYNSVLVKAAANTATRQAAAAAIVSDGGNDDNDDKAAIKPIHQKKRNNEEDEVSSVMGDMLTMIQAKTKHPQGLFPVGITTYTQLFSLEELSEMELKANELQNKAESGSLPDCCFHTTASKSGGLKRTKYFFGARYLWTRDQLSAADSKVAGGVRADVPAVPQWMKRHVEQPLVQAGLLPPDWIDSIALNMYHDGSEGIQSHFDDAYRFERPIHSLRLFSDSRLSFGTQLYGYTNGAFVVPMPRGCMTVMEEGGFAADGMKHCVRPSDMSGKSAGMVLRRINPAAMQAAEEHMVDETSSWMQALSLDVSMRSEFLNAQREEQQQRMVMLRQHRRASSNGGTRDSGNSNGTGGPRIQKDVRRVMHSMIQRVIHNMKSEKRDRQTSKLMLISIVNKIEAACRMKMDLLPFSSSGTDAAEVFSLLSDMVSFVERSTVSPSRSISKPFSKPSPLQHLLVLGGRGNRVLGNAGSKKKLTPLKRHRNDDDDDGLLVKRKIIKSSSGSTDGTGGNGKRTRGGFQLTVKSVFVVEQNKNVSEMMVVENGEGIDNVGGKERSVPSLVPSTTTLLAPAPLPEAPNAMTTTSTSLLPAMAPNQSPPINKQMKLPKPKPKLKQPPCTTPKSKPATLACYTCSKGIEDTRIPKDKDKDEGEEEEDQHWICTGPCLRSFHFSCTSPAVLGGFLGTRCSECSLGSHPCFVCGKCGPSNNNNNTGDATIKCSMAKCGRYYHPRCVRSNKLAQFKSDKSFKCMAHYCAHCERSGDGVAMVQCISCPSAYHAKCKPSGGYQQITRKLIICPICL